MNKKKEISNAIKKLKDENRCYGLDYLVVFLVNERKLNVKDFHSMKLKRCILEHLNNILYNLYIDNILQLSLLINLIPPGFVLIYSHIASRSLNAGDLGSDC